MKRSTLFTVAVVLLAALAFPAMAEIELPVANGSLEALPAGVSATDALGKIPVGWAVWHDHEAFSVSLSDEKAFDGNYSLKLSNDDAKGVFISSKPVAVEQGKTYAAIVNVLNVKDAPDYQDVLHVYVEFYKDEGWWGATDYWSEAAWQAQGKAPWNVGNRVSSIQHVPKTFDNWEEVFILATAPEGAKYMTVSFWTAHRKLQAYVDGLLIAALD